MPRRGRRPDGPDHAPALAAGLPVRGSRRERRRAGARAAARRRSRRVPRHERTARRARRALPAPRRVAGVRPQRGVRPALPVPRLEVRRRRQRASTCPPSPRAPRSATRHAAPRPTRRAKAAASSGSGWGRAGRDARVRAAGLGAAPRLPHRHRQDARRLQLGAGARGLDRLGAQLEPALDRHAGGARSTAPRRPARRGRGRRTTRRRSCSSSRRPTASATRRSASRSANPETHQYVAPRCSSRRSRC